MPVKIPKSDLKELQNQLGISKDLDFIKAGGFKAVYKTEIQGTVEALKIVPIPDADEEEKEENIERIIRELRLLQECTSKYLVKMGKLLPEIKDIQSRLYLVYTEEMLPGETLDVKIKDNYKPDKKELVELILCLIDVIKNLWSIELKAIHRDITPNNVFCTGEKKRPFVLLDLGIAFILGETGLTKNTMAIPGKLYYLAPEMLKRGFRQTLDYRADLYAIGLTAYEYASGINPFVRRRDAIYTTMTRIAKVKPKPIEEIRDDLPFYLCQLINQLLRKLPALRPSNLKILENELKELL